MSIILKLKGYDGISIFTSVIALSVSAMPEGLPLALTMALTVSSNRMQKKNVIVKKLNIAKNEVSQDNIVTEVVDFIMDWDKKMQELRIRFIIQFQLLINLMTKCKNMPELQKRINTLKEKTKKIREELALLGYFDKPKKEDNK